MSNLININILTNLTFFFFILYKYNWKEITGKSLTSQTVPNAGYNFLLPRLKTANIDIAI